MLLVQGSRKRSVLSSAAGIAMLLAALWVSRGGRITTEEEGSEGRRRSEESAQSLGIGWASGLSGVGVGVGGGVSGLTDESSPSDFEAEQIRRKVTVEEVCSGGAKDQKTGNNRFRLKMDVGTQRSVNKAFTVMPRHKLIWCRVGKAGTSTWSQVFLALFGFKKNYRKGLCHEILKRVEARKVPWRIKMEMIRSIRHRVARSNNTKNNFSGGFRSMLIARHPIDRLRSAFMDKFVRGNYSDSIRLWGRSEEERFRSFLILMSGPKQPFDTHWSPIHRLCDPCRYRFDYILRMESFTEDSNALLGEVMGTAARVEDNGKKHDIKGKEHYSELLAGVSAKTIYAIMAKYRRDFQLFGYDQSVFYEIARDRSPR